MTESERKSAHLGVDDGALSRWQRMLSIARKGKPKHPLGCGVGLTEMLVHRLPRPALQRVMTQLGLVLVALGIGGIWSSIQ